MVVGSMRVVQRTRMIVLRTLCWVAAWCSHWSQQNVVRVGVMLIADSVRCLKYRPDCFHCVQQVFATLLTCCFMLSSSSSITPRSWTEWAGEMLSLLTVIERSHVVSFDRFACEPNHIASVLAEFSCNRRDAHQAAMSLAHSDNLRRMLSTSMTWPLAYACLSLSYRWNLTVWRMNTLGMSLVYALNCWGPRTLPCGTLQSRM